jgi:hypothetical protein
MAKTCALTIVAFLAASHVLAWNGIEHQGIGKQAYHFACWTARHKYSDSPDPAVVSRLNMACTPVGSESPGDGSPFVYEDLAGEWSALAADHTESPDQLTSILLGDIVVDNRVFTHIVMTNYRHFHPASVTSWRTEHLKSVQAAAAAGMHQGLQMVTDFEAAFAIEAFAQHYLQDSFASGHMGFNRVASSNAAALRYHDKWSRRGRCVSNSKSEAWYTYGDDHYQSRDGATHVLRAATASMYDFLSAFIETHPSATQWQTTLSEFPSSFSDVVTSAEGCTPGLVWSSLRTVSRPAESVVTYELSTMTDSSIYRPAARGVMVGASLDAGSLPLGYRPIQARFVASMGMTVHQLGGHAYLLDFGEVLHVGTSLNGALTHELGYGETIYYLPGSYNYYEYLRVSVRALYAANLELGTVFLRLQVGAAHASGRWGPHVGLGIGVVRQVKE